MFPFDVLYSSESLGGKSPILREDCGHHNDIIFDTSNLQSHKHTLLMFKTVAQSIVNT